MYLSIDLGIKNLGIFMTDDEGVPFYMEKCSLYPYTTEKLISKMDNIIEIIKDKNLYNLTVIVERQLPKNFKICRIMYHVECYFYILKKNININLENFILINSKCKNINLNLSYNSRKKESICLAKKYLQKYNKVHLNKFMSFKKKDDIADAICQLYYFLNVELPDKIIEDKISGQ
jgi:hypothetical protein